MLGHTLASFFKAEGIAEGIAEGEARGEARGFVKGKAEAIMEVLISRFGNFDEYKFLYIKLLHINDMKNLSTILNCAINSKSIDDFLSYTNTIE
jgi:hypothetical protein